ncbi:hypothetical protein [Cellulosilyticum ruminicola]|uniref:hypothetical protein n=1 Tax=Cellulosilyticum ruminicola TaxID=425254 RepID=UPI0006D0B6C2|nr:hypothetical protein [Cellulosilyticum ruminicola]
MDEKQMEELIAGIRQNESQSQSLSEILMQFSESFTRLMAQIEDVGRLKEFKISHEKIVNLEATLSEIKEDIELINTAQLDRIDELGRKLENKLTNDFKDQLKHELKTEILQGVDHIIERKFIAYEANSLIIENRKYKIDETRRLIYQHLLNKEKDRIYSIGENTIIYENTIKIRGILKGYDEKEQSRVLVYLENGEVHMI